MLNVESQFRQPGKIARHPFRRSKSEQLGIGAVDNARVSVSVFRGSEMAEEVGFEPTVPVTRDGGFQDRCLKPLDHSSGWRMIQPEERESNFELVAAALHGIRDHRGQTVGRQRRRL